MSKTVRQHPTDSGVVVSGQRRQGRAEEHWSTYPVGVFDVDAVWVGPDPGSLEATSRRLEVGEVASGADVAEIGDGLGIGDTVGLGELVLTPRLCERLGLVVDRDFTDELETQPDDAAERTKLNRILFRRLTESPGGQEFLRSLAAAGWSVDAGSKDGPVEIRPRMRVSKGRRSLVLVLAAYTSVWDPSRRGGPQSKRVPPPDPIADPEGYAAEFAARAGLLRGLLGCTWKASARATGQELVDQGATHPEQAGVWPLDLGMLEVVEPGPSWERKPRADEVSEPCYLHVVDGRATYLARCQGDMPEGDPVYHDSGAVAELLAAAGPDKLPLGLFRVVAPAWDVASLPPPHPHMRADEPVQLWVATPTLWLLTHPSRGLGLDVQVLEAWVWPGSRRPLPTWAGKLRTALQRVGEQGEDALWGAIEARTLEEREFYRGRMRTWQAVEASIKEVYAGYLGALVSTSRKHTARPWHYQPAWLIFIRSWARVWDWQKLAAHGEACGVYPVFAGGRDEYHFLSGSAAPVVVEDDTGALGKLREKTTARALPSWAVARLAGGERYSDVLLDVQLGRDRAGQGKVPKQDRRSRRQTAPAAAT